MTGTLSEAAGATPDILTRENLMAAVAIIRQACHEAVRVNHAKLVQSGGFDTEILLTCVNRLNGSIGGIDIQIGQCNGRFFHGFGGMTINIAIVLGSRVCQIVIPLHQETFQILV